MGEDKLGDLIAWAESASADETKAILRAAFDLARSERWITAEQFDQDTHWIEQEAFTDAALTLVPEGWSVNINIYPIITGQPPVARTFINGEGDVAKDDHDTGGAALALCIAALKARQS